MGASVPSARLGIVILAVRELEPAARFYREALGAALTVSAPSYRELTLPQELRLGLYERQGFARNLGCAPSLPEQGAISGAELYFYVDDPAAMLGRALALGARLLSEVAPREWGDLVGYCSDPDGNVVAFARRL
jgi:catechol 2,3-dioxygenase-like lactoylglutathione lyase family enzyme